MTTTDHVRSVAVKVKGFVVYVIARDDGVEAVIYQNGREFDGELAFAYAFDVDLVNDDMVTSFDISEDA
jgi:hypothetical protein